MIRQNREGRVVVLTTHFMDEADLLGDRIAIMGDGKLRCCGSSLFLKNAFGVGYNMTIEKADPSKFKAEPMEQLVLSLIPEAKVLTDVGTELTFQLPFSSSASFPTLFESIDTNEQSLGVRSYGMSVTTLEEVFIKVAEGTKTQAEAEAGRKDGGVNGASSLSNVQLMTTNDKFTSVTDFERINEDNKLGYLWYHMKAMLIKRFLYFKRDSRSWIYQFVVPVFFVLIGMLIMRVSDNYSLFMT